MKKPKRRNFTQELQDKLLEDVRHDDGTVWPPAVAAAYLGVSEWTLRRWRRPDVVAIRGPWPLWVEHSGNKIGYEKKDLDEYKRRRRRQPDLVEPLPEAELAPEDDVEGPAP